jgi:transposase
VRPLDQVQDPEELRARARAAEASLVELTDRLDRVFRTLGKSEAEKQQVLAEVRAAAERAGRAVGVPGHSSEKRPHTDKKPKEKQPQTGHGPTEQTHLPVVEEPVQKLDEADCTCPKCGEALEEWEGHFEESEEIDVVVRQHVRKLKRRQKYRCSCGQIESPLAEPRVVPGGRYSNEFALQVAVNKHLDHLPLERQVRMMEREGLEVTSQTLWDQELALYRLLKSAKDRLKEYLLHRPVLGVDETRWPVFGKETKNWTMWCVADQYGVFYDILEGRGGEQAQAVLKDYQGQLMVDGYVVYEWLARGSLGLLLAFCWAHVRRHFQEIETSFPVEVKQVLDLIGQLFAIEKEATSVEDLAEKRRTKSRAVTEEIYRFLTTTPSTPGSGLRKAMSYVANRWTGLTRFLDNPAIPLTNNATERAQRGPVVGRKVFYGSHSKQGTEVAAVFYSLVESAKLCGLNPVAYLRIAMNTALAGEQIPLPHEVMGREDLRLISSN